MISISGNSIIDPTYYDWFFRGLILKLESILSFLGDDYTLLLFNTGRPLELVYVTDLLGYLLFEELDRMKSVAKSD